MFNTDREERDRRERNRNGARNDAEHSDDDAESQKTEISTTTNDQDIYGDAKPQVARNIRDDGRRRNRPSKQSANAEADYLSMSSTQMRNHLETIENLVEENNQMKEQVGQRIKETHHHQFLANEYQSVMQEQVHKANQYKQIMLQTQATYRSSSMFSSEKNDKM